MNRFYQFILATAFTTLPAIYTYAETIDSLQFINCFRMVAKDKLFGGISGIDMDSDTTFYAVSDRNGLFKCKIMYSKDGISDVKIIKTYPKINNQIKGDLESVRQSARQIFVSNEEKNVYVINKKEGTVGSVTFPAMYKDNFRSNKGIEGMDLTNEHFWIINEKPLKNDETILRLGQLNSKGILQHQYAYPYDAGNEGEDGMCATEIVPYKTSSFLVLERTFNKSKQYNIIKVYLAEISNASDIKNIVQVDEKVQPVSKRCIATVDADFKCHNGLVNIKNIEGMTWLSKDYILMVVDNNFMIPETDFYLFKVVNKP